MKNLKIIIKVFFTSFVMLVLFILLSFLLIRISTYRYISQSVDSTTTSEAVVILGASIFKNGNLSEVLKDRVDKAIELYKAEKVKKILVSGDNSTVFYNEVSPVRLYLLEKNIPDEDIFLDHAGFDTYSSMYRARDIFKVKSMVVVTQSFHLPRSIFIARSLGLDAYGLSADNGKYKISNYVREIFANEKAILNLIFNRKPKYLGEEIPVTGE